jgi:hypothetical protein
MFSAETQHTNMPKMSKIDARTYYTTTRVWRAFGIKRILIEAEASRDTNTRHSTVKGRAPKIRSREH